MVIQSSIRESSVSLWEVAQHLLIQHIVSGRGLENASFPVPVFQE